MKRSASGGVPIDSRAFGPDFAEQMRAGYPFHPELIRLFAERLADIPEFQATRGALHLRTLLTHEEPDEAARSRDAPRKPKKGPAGHEKYSAPVPDSEARTQAAREALGEFSARLRKQEEQEISREGPIADPENMALGPKHNPGGTRPQNHNAEKKKGLSAPMAPKPSTSTTLD